MKKKGKKLPWGEPPPLSPGDGFYLASFWELTSERIYGQGALGPIPWSAIIKYAEWVGLDREMQKVFLDVIRALDAEWLKYQNAQLESARKQHTPRPKSK